MRLCDTTTSWETSSKANQCVTPPWRTNKTAISAEEWRVTHYEGVTLHMSSGRLLTLLACVRQCVFVGERGKKGAENEHRCAVDLIWIFSLQSSWHAKCQSAHTNTDKLTPAHNQ